MRRILSGLLAATILSMPVPWAQAESESVDHGDGSRWTARERRVLRSLYLDPQLQVPPSPSNSYADDPGAIELGRKLFFDAQLSDGGERSCASCHQPDRYFTDGEERAVGARRLSRHTPTIIGVAFQSWFYWDGRRDSLWSQALVPFEAADEMGSSRTAVVRRVAGDPDYSARYRETFGALPADLVVSELPVQAGPLGDEATQAVWFQLPTQTQRRVNEVYVNLGKAVAAYERALPLPPPSRFDRYVAAVIDEMPMADSLLTEEEQEGLALFIDDSRTHCLRCHNGPWFTNGGFHNIGTGVFSGSQLDFGRVYGLPAALMDEFNCLGPYSDAEPEQCLSLRYLNRSAHAPLEGAFKVPGLRNVAKTSPYMHDGRFATLAAVLAFYTGEIPTQQGEGLPSLRLSEREIRQLIAFLMTLTVDS